MFHVNALGLDGRHDEVPIVQGENFAVMDRFDALLFALPTTYYLAQVLHIL